MSKAKKKRGPKKYDENNRCQKWIFECQEAGCEAKYFQTKRSRLIRNVIQRNHFVKEHNCEVDKLDTRFGSHVKKERKTDDEWAEVLLTIKAKNLKKGGDVGIKSALKPKPRKNKVKLSKEPIVPPKESKVYPVPSAEEKGDCNVQVPLK